MTRSDGAATQFGVGKTVATVILLGILVLCECGMAAIGLSSNRAGRFAEVAPLVVFGGSGVVGAVVYVLAAIAMARRTRGHGLARVVRVLAWLRVLAVVVALVVVALVFGLDSIAGPSLWLASILGLFIALLQTWLAGITVAKTRSVR